LSEKHFKGKDTTRYFKWLFICNR